MEAQRGARLFFRRMASDLRKCGRLAESLDLDAPDEATLEELYKTAKRNNELVNGMRARLQQKKLKKQPWNILKGCSVRVQRFLLDPNVVSGSIVLKHGAATQGQKVAGMKQLVATTATHMARRATALSHLFGKTYRMRTINVARIMHRLREYHTSQHGTPPIHFEIRPGNVTVDPHLLYWCIDELLSNARKATEPSGTINVRTFNRQGAHCIEIKDNGIGIEPDRMPGGSKSLIEGNQGFDPVKSKPGSGNVLPNIKRVLSQFDAQLEIESEGPKKGAVFRIILPKPARLRAKTKPAG